VLKVLIKYLVVTHWPDQRIIACTKRAKQRVYESSWRYTVYWSSRIQTTLLRTKPLLRTHMCWGFPTKTFRAFPVSICSTTYIDITHTSHLPLLGQHITELLIILFLSVLYYLFLIRLRIFLRTVFSKSLICYLLLAWEPSLTTVKKVKIHYVYRPVCMQAYVSRLAAWWPVRLRIKKVSL
jgi:hypothetical protein